MTRVGVVTQARMTSTRLPGKVLLRAAGRTVLDHHLDRLEAAALDPCVATTTNVEDDPVVALAEGRGVPVWRGSEHDVLGRFAGCVRAHDLDVVVRVTSDCPLIDGAVVARGVEEFRQADNPWCYVSNGVHRSFPRGMDFEVFSAEALLDADSRATRPADREHVTPFLYSGRSHRVELRHVTHHPDASHLRVTLDTQDDWTLIRTLIEQHDAARLGVDQIIELLNHHPDLVAINAHVEQKGVQR